jgi:hypothetical protein
LIGQKFTKYQHEFFFSTLWLSACQLVIDSCSLRTIVSCEGVDWLLKANENFRNFIKKKTKNGF